MRSDASAKSKVVFVFLIAMGCVCPGDVFAKKIQSGTSIELASQSLLQFEKLFYGLSFKKSWEDKLVYQISISNDGKLRKAIWEEKTQHGSFHRGSYANSELGWLFSTYQIPPSLIDPKDPEGLSRGSPHTVDFALAGQDPSALNPAFGDYVFGFAQRRRFSETLNEYDVKEAAKLHLGKTFKGVKCQHKDLPDLEFYFDDAGRLVFIKEEVRPGNQLAGSRFVPPTTVPGKKRSDFLIGPIKYGPFGDREVITSYEISVKADGGFETQAQFVFSDYQKLDHDLSKKIDMPEFDLENGQRINCTGDSPLIYEYLSGKVVIAVDDRSVEAAEKARFSASPRGRLRFYTLMGGSLIAVFVVFIWHRNRD